MLPASALLEEWQNHDIPVRKASGYRRMALKKDAWEVSWKALEGIVFQNTTGACHH